MQCEMTHANFPVGLFVQDTMGLALISCTVKVDKSVFGGILWVLTNVYRVGKEE